MTENTTYFIFIGAAVVALVVIATLVSYVASFTRGVATKRELEALKQEVKDERQRVDEILKQQFDLIRGLTAENTERYNRLESSIKSWQLGIERLIGKIEGKVDSK